MRAAAHTESYHSRKPFTGMSTSFLRNMGFVEGSLYRASSHSEPSASSSLFCMLLLSAASTAADVRASATPEKDAAA